MLDWLEQITQRYIFLHHIFFVYLFSSFFMRLQSPSSFFLSLIMSNKVNQNWIIKINNISYSTTIRVLLFTKHTSIDLPKLIDSLHSLLFLGYDEAILALTHNKQILNLHVLDSSPWNDNNVWWTSCFTGSALPQNTRKFGKAARALCLPGRHLILIGVFVCMCVCI